VPATGTDRASGSAGCVDPAALAWQEVPTQTLLPQRLHFASTFRSSRALERRSLALMHQEPRARHTYPVRFAT